MTPEEFDAWVDEALRAQSKRIEGFYLRDEWLRQPVLPDPPAILKNPGCFGEPDVPFAGEPHAPAKWE